MFRYEEFISRNFPLISKEEEKKLWEIRVGIAGCGMGSQVAVALARLGVVNFLIADGDVVEVSNLNRQAYRIDQVGFNKAESLKEILIGINNSNVVSIPAFLRTEDVNEFVSAVDLLIDCIDPSFGGLRVSLALNEACRRQGKLDFYPMPCGWGGSLYVFAPEGISLQQFFGTKPEELEGKEGFPMECLFKALRLPEYMGSVVEALKRGDLHHYPQLIVATAITSSLVAMAVVKVIRGEKIRVVPDFYFLDPFEG